MKGPPVRRVLPASFVDLNVTTENPGQEMANQMITADPAESKFQIAIEKDTNLLRH